MTSIVRDYSLGPVTAPPDVTDVAAAAVQLHWYHTIDLPGGVTTPGRYDHRPIVNSLPWPDLRGKRCIDVGSRDGFLAFEMERRGATEVVSLDIADPSDVDFPTFRPPDEEIRDMLAMGNRAFELARLALGSEVRREILSAYRLSPDLLGTFDFAIVGTLLLHLRDPVRALAGINSVLQGQLLVNEVIDPSLDVLRRRPMAHPVMTPGMPFWWSVNRPGLEQFVRAGGFEVERVGRPYILPNGPGAPAPGWRETLRAPLREIPWNLVRRRGDVHCWLLARTIS